MSKELRDEILSWIKGIAFAILFAVFITNFVIVNANVPTGSMMNTIPEKSRIIAFRLAYIFSEPKRYDVVVFKFPDNREKLFVKRVIGLPGESLEIIGGKVYVNGDTTPLDDSFVDGGLGKGDGIYEVPEGCYFMLGDNRDDSDDARFWKNKYVVAEDILGSVFMVYYPVFRLVE